MKRIIPVLLALLLLLGGCARTQQQTPAEGELPAETPAAPTETAAAEKSETNEEEETMPSDRIVTMDGIDSYLRLTLPEGWTVVEDYMQSGEKCLLLVPPTNDAFQIRVVCWDSFGMCGTGVSFEEKTLPNGLTVTLASEEGSDGIVWKTVILPPKTEQFTLQMYALPAVYAEHQAEIDEILASLQLGELSHIPPQPTTPTVDK